MLEQLFANGKSFLVFPIKVFYLPVNDVATVSRVQAGVGTSSRNFKHAADRNSIKRLIREAYRLNKLPLHEFLTTQQKKVAVFFLYIDKALPQENIVQQKMPLVLEKLMKHLS